MIGLLVALLVILALGMAVGAMATMLGRRYRGEPMIQRKGKSDGPL